MYDHNMLYLTTTDLTMSCTVAFPVKSYYFPCALCRRDCRPRLLLSYFVLISLTAQRSAWDLEVLTYKWVLAGLCIITYNATVILSLLQYNSVGIYYDPKRISKQYVYRFYDHTKVVVFMRFDLFPVQMTLGHVSLMEATVARSMVSRWNRVKTM